MQKHTQGQANTNAVRTSKCRRAKRACKSVCKRMQKRIHARANTHAKCVQAKANVDAKSVCKACRTVSACKHVCRAHTSTRKHACKAHTSTRRRIQTRTQSAHNRMPIGRMQIAYFAHANSILRTSAHDWTQKHTQGQQTRTQSAYKRTQAYTSACKAHTSARKSAYTHICGPNLNPGEKNESITFCTPADCSSPCHLASEHRQYPYYGQQGNAGNTKPPPLAGQPSTQTS